MAAPRAVKKSKRCLRVANLLDKLVREGKARRVSRGVHDLDSYGPAEELEEQVS
jgi:hypothetical protein